MTGLHLAVFYAALSFLAGACLEGLIAPRKYEKRGGRLDRTWDGGYEAGQEDLARELEGWEDERDAREHGRQEEPQVRPLPQPALAPAVYLRAPLGSEQGPPRRHPGPAPGEERGEAEGWHDTAEHLAELARPHYPPYDSPGPVPAATVATPAAGPGVDRDPYWLERGMVWLAEWHRETWELEEQGNALVAAWVAESRAMLAESSWTNRMLEAANHG